MKESGKINKNVTSESFTSKLEAILTGIKVSGIPSTAATKMQTTSPMFEEIMYLMNCLVLLYIARPSATACRNINHYEDNQKCSRFQQNKQETQEKIPTATIVAKLSSAKTISEAL